MKVLKINLLIIALGVMAATSVASAAEVSGRLVGHDCAHQGKVCPVDKLDPHLVLERDFVLVKTDGDYYFLPNLPRTVKVRHVLETVTVKGKLDDKYNSIMVDKIHVSQNGKKREVWSQKSQSEIERIWRISPD